MSCLNFWDKAWWFLSLSIFGLLSSSLLLIPQRFGWYALRVQQTPEKGRRTYQPKHCGNSNKDEDNSPKTLYDN